MQRLAVVQGPGEGETTERRPYRAGVGAYFGLGLAGGGAAGAAVLLTLQAFGAIQLSPLRAEIPAAIAALAHWVSEPPVSRLGRAAPIVAREPQPDAFDVVIDSSDRANAPFGLRLVGTQDAGQYSGMEVLLRDVPAAAVLSSGERRGESTWALRAAELENLHLTLNEGAPDTFNVRIEVLAPAGVAAASSVARVRLVGRPAVERTAQVPAELAPRVPEDTPAVTAASVDTPLQRTVAAVRNEVAKVKERVARVTVHPVATTVIEIDRRPPQQAAAAPQAEARHWPEGASGLGAIARETDRQVWWKMPAPTWSPFVDMAGR